MTFGKFASFSMMIVAVTLGGCAANVGDETETLETSQEELMTLTAGWSQGQAAVNLGSSSNRFCFLTSIAGKFAGGGESVRLQIVSGQWQLTGTSGQRDVAAIARCQLNVTGADITSESVWSQGQGEVNLGSTANRACFLMGVQGKFEGGGEAVWVRKSGGNYLLGGQSQQAGVGARARCLRNRITFTNDWTWNQSQGATTMVQAFVENDGWACGLTRMTGRFHGGGERIYIDWTGSTRRLLGTSAQVDVGTSANCF